MRKRTVAREYALQALYQVDLTQEPSEEALKRFWDIQDGEEVTEEVRQFCEELLKGAIKHRSIIDERISSYATNWKLERMAVVDRNILRLGCFELIYREDIPPKVSINEAVELAKKFSGIEAAKFVNGILDKVKIEQKR